MPARHEYRLGTDTKQEPTPFGLPRPSRHLIDARGHKDIMHHKKTQTPVVRQTTPVSIPPHQLPCGMTREELRKIVLEQIG